VGFVCAIEGPDNRHGDVRAAAALAVSGGGTVFALVLGALVDFDSKADDGDVAEDGESGRGGGRGVIGGGRHCYDLEFWLEE